VDPDPTLQSEIADPAWTATAEPRTRPSPPRGDALEQQLVEARHRIALLEHRIAAQGRARTELVHLVSHELRTPITVISGFARLLQSESGGPLGPEQHRYIEECLAACRRLDRFVEDLLEACPDSPCALSVEPREGNLDETIRGLLESLTPMLDERGQQVETAWGGACRVLFDGGRIEQVVTNLVTNAVRHGRAGGRIRVSTELVVDPRTPDRDARVEAGCGERLQAWVSVEDDGPGIAETDRERLFQPYVRGPNAQGLNVRETTVERTAAANAGSEESAAGLGIGLAICHRIIAAHGGRIAVEDSALGGARFCFVLPCVRASTAGSAAGAGR